jgi:hypothetical protein
MGLFYIFNAKSNYKGEGVAWEVLRRDKLYWFN